MINKVQTKYMEGQDLWTAINTIEYPSTYEDIFENISLLKTELAELRDKLILFQGMLKRDRKSELSKSDGEFVQRTISDLELLIKTKETMLSVYENRLRLVEGKMAG